MYVTMSVNSGLPICIIDYEHNLYTIKLTPKEEVEMGVPGLRKNVQRSKSEVLH